MLRIQERDPELGRLRQHYARRDKEDKSRSLDEFCEQYGCERKYDILSLFVRFGSGNRMVDSDLLCQVAKIAILVSI